MYDVILEGGMVVDALHGNGALLDIAIKDGRIVNTGKLKREMARERIQLSGLVVSPGFIDTHSHSDETLLLDGRAQSKIYQGITTEIIGNCGSSAAPYSTRPPLREGQTWETLWGYLDYLERKGISVNIIPLVGHNNIRSSVMGMTLRRPQREEMERMGKTLQEALEDGGFGLSTGLIYPPGCFSSTDELIHLSRILRDYQGLYVTHLRGEGKDLLLSLKEAIRVGFAAQVPVHISHHKVTGKRNWGQAGLALKMMEKAREQGLDISCDLYPYTASNTLITHLLPPYAQEGGVGEMIKRLHDPHLRSAIKRDILEGLPGWESTVRDCDLHDIIISHSESHPSYEGRDLYNLSRLIEKDPFDLLFQLIEEDYGETTIIIFEIGEKDIQEILSYPYTMIGTDGYALSRDPSLCQGLPHPRSFGTFPRVLERYVKKEGLLSLGEAITRMTRLPAWRFNIQDRGLIRAGYIADLVAFDYDRVRERSTYLDPYQFPEGIEYVFVNGSPVIFQGCHSGELPGRVVRRSREVGTGKGLLGTGPSH